MKRFLVFLALFAAVACGVGFWYLRASGEPAPNYRTAAVKRGTVTATISATGTLEPEEVVDDGAQVAGMVQRFGQDPQNPKKVIDYGTPVEAGTVLAQIDDAVYRSQVEQARANVQKAEADLAQMKAKVNQTQRDWDRAQTLGPSRGAISGVDYDTARVGYETAQA